MLTNPLPVRPTPANLLPDDLMHIDPPPENGPLVNITLVGEQLPSSPLSRPPYGNRQTAAPVLVGEQLLRTPNRQTAPCSTREVQVDEGVEADTEGDHAFMSIKAQSPIEVIQPPGQYSRWLASFTGLISRFQSPLTPGATPLSNPSTPVWPQQSTVLLQSPREQPFVLNTDCYFQRALQSSPSHQKLSPTQIPISQHQLSEQTIAPPSDSLPSVFLTNDQPHSISTPSTAQVLPETIISQAPTQDGHWRQAMNNNSDNDIAATLLMGMRDLAKEVEALHNDVRLQRPCYILSGGNSHSPFKTPSQPRP
ncbi:hypothetical protein CPB84DRAFT_1852815 [Gymnopilus junonius]|uniref:Uncharacterized protein n=1 Tax=Gymnopilus junonius TaxID=109634 RepID=A0A9P5NB56_GYMJU|nr:hypothetical protein CPB84DRAFT_1852815 [Gymnopilus junonius]